MNSVFDETDQSVEVIFCTRPGGRRTTGSIALKDKDLYNKIKSVEQDGFTIRVEEYPPLGQTYLFLDRENDEYGGTHVVAISSTRNGPEELFQKGIELLEEHLKDLEEYKDE